MLSQFSAGQSWAWFLSEICFGVAQWVLREGGLCAMSYPTDAGVWLCWNDVKGCNTVPQSGTGLLLQLFWRPHCFHLCTLDINLHTWPFPAQNYSSRLEANGICFKKEHPCVSTYGWDKTPADVQSFPCLELRLAQADAMELQQQALQRVPVKHGTHPCGSDGKNMNTLSTSSCCEHLLLSSAEGWQIKQQPQLAFNHSEIRVAHIQLFAAECCEEG